MSSKAYLVYLRGQIENESYVIADVSREEFMGIPCIKGTYRPNTSPSYYMAGRTIYIPLDKVLYVMEYESLDAYREAVKRHYEGKAK